MISPSELSPTALLPLFDKTEAIREQHVSSYYAVLCLSKNTQAAPWQLTTHSQLSNAANPPKRPLFNVTRWHCVMQAKHCDMICSDSLFKWKYCTCGGHGCTDDAACLELDMERSPPSFRAWGCNHQVPVHECHWFGISSLHSYLDFYGLTRLQASDPDRLRNAPSQLLRRALSV